MSEPTEHNLNHQLAPLRTKGPAAIPVRAYPEATTNLREVLPKLCKQLRPVSSGSEIGPGEAVALETGMLSDTTFPDLIAVAGSFEFEVSLMEARQFDAALARCADGSPRRVIGVDVDVDPDLTIDAFSGPIRFRGLDDALIPVTCDGPSRVLPDKSAWFIARSTRAFHPSRLAIDRRSQDWRIVDVHVEGKSQFPQAGVIPGDAFHPDTLDCFATFDVVSTGGSFAIKAHYVGPNPRGGSFGAVVRGRLDP